MDRQEVYKIIDGERDYQDKKWGGKEHDSQHDVEDFADYMFNYTEELKQAYHRGNGSRMLENMRKIAALCVACGEVFTLPERT